MTEETKNKIREAHKNLAKDPAVLARLRKIASDPAMKASRSAKMKAKWADPEWRARQLAKRPATKTGPPKKLTENEQLERRLRDSRAIQGQPPVPKKRIISPEQKLKYAAARKAKRAAAKI